MNYGKKLALFRPSSRSIESESVLSFDDLEEDEKDTVKRKTRNLSEKKRRDQFNVLINELCSMVASNNKKLDKSSVLKSAIQFLQNHQEFSAQSAANEIKEDWKPTFLCNEEFTQLMLEAVDSFLVVFTQQGKVLFTSDSVTSLLGHLAGDLINHSLYDLMHEDDRLKVFDLLSKQVSESGSISFTCHLRCGNIDPKESSTYEYVQVYGTSQVVSELEEETYMSDNTDFIGIDLPEQSICYCCTVRLVTSHIIREMSTVDESTCEFTSRHSLEWKFLFLDHRAPPIIGYLPFEVLGTSGYDYYHPDDLEAVSKCHEQLMVMGKGTSSFYRFLTKGQQWIWLQTRYFITYHQWNSKPEFIVCTNTVVNYCDVRRQLRQEMGYQDGDSGNSASATNSTSSTLSLPSNSKECRSPQGQVTSYGQSEGLGLIRGSIVQSPDVASSQHPDCDRVQLLHSTKQENSTRKHVSSQLQSLLQLHLQRSSLSSATSTPSPSQAALISSGTGNTATVAASASAIGPSRRSSVSQTPLRPPSVSKASGLAVSGQPARPSQSVASLIPIMTALPSSWAPQPTLTSQAQSTLVNQTVDISSPQTSPSISNQQPSYQSGLVLTAAQQLLHEQLIQKSEQLQDAIQKQQEELRLIKEQLAYAHGGNIVQQQQQQPPPPQQQQPQQKHQHQYILQQRLGLQAHSMVLSPSAPRHQLAIMSSNPNEIFLSPITNLNMDMSQTTQPEPLTSQLHQKQQQQPPPQQPQTQQQQSQQQQQQAQLSHSHQQHTAPLYQHQQILLQQDAGLAGQHMVLAPNSPVHQLAMMTPSASQIFLSPIANISMDLQQQQQQQQPLQQVQAAAQPPTQSLHFPPVASCSSSDPNSTNVDLSDSC